MRNRHAQRIAKPLMVLVALLGGCRERGVSPPQSDLTPGAKAVSEDAGSEGKTAVLDQTAGAAGLAFDDASWDREEPSLNLNDLDAPLRDQLNSLVADGDGIYLEKKEADGRVRSCVAVGQAQIHPAFPPQEGEARAVRRAKLAARIELCRWLAESRPLTEPAEQSSTSESVDFGPTATDGLPQAAQQAFTSCLGGLILLHQHVDPENGLATAVYGWKAEKARGDARSQRGIVLSLKTCEEIGAQQTRSRLLVNGVLIQELATTGADASKEQLTQWYPSGQKYYHRLSEGQSIQQTAWYENGQVAGQILVADGQEKITRYRADGTVVIGDEGS